MIIKAVLLAEDKPFICMIEVNNINCRLILKKLELEKRAINNKLKEYQQIGLIKSISIPKTKNRKMQGELDLLIDARRIAGKSIEKIKEFYF